MLRESLVAATLFVGCGSAEAPRPAVPVPRATAPALAKDWAPPPRDDGRLPKGVRPTRYALDLTVDPAKPEFSGHTRIAVTIEKPTRAIVLHGRDLVVKRVTLTTARGKLEETWRSRMASGAKEPEELVVSFDDEAPAGEGELDFEYEAAFSKGLV